MSEEILTLLGFLFGLVVGFMGVEWLTEWSSQRRGRRKKWERMQTLMREHEAFRDMVRGTGSAYSTTSNNPLAGYDREDETRD